MGVCKDPALTYLNGDGYNVIKLPRFGIEPLDVLGRDQSLEKLGTISEVWTSSVPVPQPGAPTPVGGLEGKKSSDLDIGVGLKILANALAGLGSAIGLPTLNTTYKSAKSVQFKFTNVISVQVTPFGVGKYLSAGSLDTGNPFVKNYFGNDGTEEYILTEVLKSDSVSVTAKRDANNEVKLDVPVLKGIVGANVDVKVGSSTEGEVVYTGKIPITFGFKAYQVFFADGAWTVQGTKPSGDLAFAIDDSSSVKPLLLAQGNLVRII